MKQGRSHLPYVFWAIKTFERIIKALPLKIKTQLWMQWRIQRGAQQARAPSKFWSTIVFVLLFSFVSECFKISLINNNRVSSAFKRALWTTLELKGLRALCSWCALLIFCFHYYFHYRRWWGRAAGQGMIFTVINIGTGYLNRPNWLLAGYSVYHRVASSFHFFLL